MLKFASQAVAWNLSEESWFIATQHDFGCGVSILGYGVGPAQWNMQVEKIKKIGENNIIALKQQLLAIIYAFLII